MCLVLAAIASFIVASKIKERLHKSECITLGLLLLACAMLALFMDVFAHIVS